MDTEKLVPSDEVENNAHMLIPANHLLENDGNFMMNDENTL